MTMLVLFKLTGIFEIKRTVVLSSYSMDDPFRLRENLKRFFKFLCKTTHWMEIQAFSKPLSAQDNTETHSCILQNSNS